MNNKPDFDNYVQNYQEIHNKNLKKLSGFGRDYFAQYKINEVKERLTYSPKNILDFGCGDGISCEILRELFPQAKITGVDVSSESIKIAQEKNIYNCDFVSYDGVNFPFESESFDLIFSACVFHHIEHKNHPKILTELKRVLRDGSKLFIFEHNPINPFTIKMFKDCVFDQDAKMISAKNFKKNIKDVGFNKFQVNYTLFFPRYELFKNLFKAEKYLKNLPLGAQYFVEAERLN